MDSLHEDIQKATRKDQWKRSYPPPPPKLPSEDLFHATVKSCIPEIHGSDDPTNQKSHKKNGQGKKSCLQHTPENSPVRQRIAILSPESILRDSFTQWLRTTLLEVYYRQDEQRMNQELEIIPSSHVPPYGYGKNHGWTKIIRLIRYPLASHWMDVVSPWIHLWEKEEVRTNRTIITDTSSFSSTRQEQRREILKASYRQVIRWHCRLSHVAAHTAMMTLDFTDSQSMAWQEVLPFVLSTPSSHEFQPETNTSHWKSLVRYNFMLEQVKAKDHSRQYSLYPSRTDLQDMEEILTEELAKTRNLQDWPCLSFWDVQNHTHHDDASLSVVNQKLARDFVPQCTAPFTTCSVKKDFCEEQGNVLCL